MLFFKNLLFTVVVPGSVAVYLPMMLAGPACTSAVCCAAATALFLVGTSLYAWCIWDFATFGHGTPAPIDAPKHLIVRGLYHHTRNPMYVAVLTTISGHLMLAPSALLLAHLCIVACCFHGFVVFYEEPALLRMFADEYLDYCARVPRWFIPKSC